MPTHSLVEIDLPGVWQADELDPTGCGGVGHVVSTGHATLNAELPGGGWPLGALVEVLQPAPTAIVWPLVWPALAQRIEAAESAVRRRGVASSPQVVVVNAPHEPYAPAFAAAGVLVSSLLWLAADAPATQLWAAEQALRCQDVAAVIAWLPRVQTTDLRRLQQAAAQSGALLFVLRPEQAAHVASPARLRLHVVSALPQSSRPRLHAVGQAPDSPAHTVQPAAELPQLRIDVIKRRGPPLQAPIWLPVGRDALCAVMQAALEQRRLGTTNRRAIQPAAPSVDGLGYSKFELQRPTGVAIQPHLPSHRHGVQVLTWPAQKHGDAHALAGVAVAAA